MEYREWDTDPVTRERVRRCWSLRGVDEGADRREAEPALPDGCPELIFNFGDPFEHVRADGSTHRQPACFLVGQISAPFDVRPTGSIDLLAVRFEPHGAYGLHDNLSRLTNRWADASVLHDASLPALWQTLRSLEDEARVHVLHDWLTDLPRRCIPADEVVQAVVREIRLDTERADPALSLATLAASYDVSVRTVQRRFLTQVGVSPKLLSRILRFHRVCLAWRHDPDTLARVAADGGYCDESHLVRDFRAFVGEPPVAFLNSLAAFTALFLSNPGTRTPHIRGK